MGYRTTSGKLVVQKTLLICLIIYIIFVTAIVFWWTQVKKKIDKFMSFHKIFLKNLLAFFI